MNWKYTPDISILMKYILLVVALLSVTFVFPQGRTSSISKERYYTIRQGSLYFHATRLFFGDGIFFGENASDTIRFVNFGTKEIDLTFEKLPPFLKCEAIPPVVEIGEEGLIVVHYNTKVKNVYGPTFDYFYAKTNDSVRAAKRLIVSPDIYEDFSTLSKKELKNPPKIYFDKTKVDLGSLIEGEESFNVFTLTNKGKRDLIIRAVKASCGCTATDISNKVIKPGDSEEIEVIFRSLGKKGKQKHSISVVSNDPNEPVVLLELSGKVIKNSKK